jgi:signal peptidase I
MKTTSPWTLALALIGAAAAYNFRSVEVTGPSMLPTFETGQRLTMVRHGLGEVKRGDVVVANAAGGTIIKRVYAVGGDHVNYLFAGHPFSAEVPAGKVFLLGDNLDQSADSRTFGLISEDAIQGKVWQQNPKSFTMPEFLTIR